MEKKNWMTGLSVLAALSAFGSGCGNKTPTTTPKPAPTPTILTVNGVQGYYSNTSGTGTFCTFTNDYCATGKAYGIDGHPTLTVQNGYQGYENSANTSFCSVLNDYCGSGLAYGIVEPSITLVGGYPGYYNSNQVFCDFGNNYCATGISWGIARPIFISNPTSYGDMGYFQNGTTTCNYANNYCQLMTFCDYANNFCGTGASWGIGAPYVYPTNTTTNTCSSAANNGSYGGLCSTGNYSGGYSNGSVGSNGSAGNSVDSSTKDVDLQRAELQSSATEDRAQMYATSYSMSIDSARQLAVLADKMTLFSNQSGGMSDEERATMMDSALSVAGISGDEVNSAYAKAIRDKDPSAVNALLEKGATNLGMSSTSVLRDQILPSLGITFGSFGQ